MLVGTLRRILVTGFSWIGSVAVRFWKNLKKAFCGFRLQRLTLNGFRNIAPWFESCELDQFNHVRSKRTSQYENWYGRHFPKLCKDSAPLFLSELPSHVQKRIPKGIFDRRKAHDYPLWVTEKPTKRWKRNRRPSTLEPRFRAWIPSSSGSEGSKANRYRFHSPNIQEIKNQDVHKPLQQWVFNESQWCTGLI